MGVERKAMLGHKVRRLRRELGLTQAQMAEELGISASYLNLVEHNQRPLTVPLLLKMGQTYAIDLTEFAEDDEAQVVAGLRETFSDPLFEGADLKVQDYRDVAAASPTMAQAVITLYRAWRESQDTLRALGERMAVDDAAGTRDSGGLPTDEVLAFIHQHANHFPDLESAAEALWADADLKGRGVWGGLTEHLRQAHGLRVQVMPLEVMGTTIRRFDRHSRRVLLSEMLPAPARSFQLALQLGLLAQGELIGKLVAGHGFASEPGRRMARLALASYFAGAVLMPYERFATAARDSRHDLDILKSRFEASFEQVCHRLTTLARPGNKGLPFFMIRLDKAGNVSKRFSAGGFHFSRYGGACPRWHVHEAFRTPNSILTQIVSLPDGATYLSLARTVTKPGGGHRNPPQEFAIGLGCEIKHAAHVLYADGLDLTRLDALAMPIGTTCRLCDRQDCPQRAHPPLGHRVEIYEHHRGLVPFQVLPPGL